MRLRQREGLWPKIKGYLLPVVFTAGLLAYLLVNMTTLKQTVSGEELKNTADNVRRAAVHCYAIEGQYPANVEYLVKNYGLFLDKERYIVHYDCFASNIMPDITVFPLDGEEVAP